MKKLIIVTAAILGIGTAAHAGGWHVSIGIGLPVPTPVVVAPPPVVVAPAPVYAPAPVVVAPAPIYAPAPVVVHAPTVVRHYYAPRVVVARPPVHYGYGHGQGWRAHTGWGHHSGWGHCR